MDFDKTREIGSAAIVQPVVVGEPGIRSRQGHKLARARMIETKGMLLAAIEHAFDARQRSDQLLGFDDKIRLGDVNVRDLMVGDGKGARLSDIENFSAILDTDAEKAGLAQRAIDVDR